MFPGGNTRGRSSPGVRAELLFLKHRLHRPVIGDSIDASDFYALVEQQFVASPVMPLCSLRYRSESLYAPAPVQIKTISSGLIV